MSVCSGICLRSSKDYGHATYTDGLAHSPLKDQLNCELSNAGWLKTVDEKTFKKTPSKSKKSAQKVQTVWPQCTALTGLTLDFTSALCN